VSSKYDKLYNNLPSFLQNIAISMYGLKEEFIRHQGIYKKYLNSIRSNLTLSADEVTAIQLRQLHEIINSASKTFYYSNFFKDHSLPVIESTSLNLIKQFPLLDKSPIRQNPESFIDNSINKSKLLIIHTTGSTGTPLNIYCTPEVRQKNYAFFSRFLESVGINLKGSRATIGGRILMPADNNSPPFWRYSYFQKSLLFSSYHLTDQNIPLYINKLQSFRPTYIDTYPSSIFVIAEYAQRNGISLKNITKAIVTSAETLFPHQRACIESTFGVPIFDQYGSAEMCIFVAQCIKGSYHVYSDYSIVEFINEDGLDAIPGEEAEIVCTSLINPVMPLIRYRIGDRAVLSEKKCECGCTFPVIEKLVGRTDDFIVTPDGRHVGRLSPVLKGFPVREAQYRQECIEEVIVNVVKDYGYTTETDQQITIELRKRLGNEISIIINHVENIERGKGGKLRTVISLIKN